MDVALKAQSFPFTVVLSTLAPSSAQTIPWEVWEVPFAEIAGVTPAGNLTTLPEGSRDVCVALQTGGVPSVQEDWTGYCDIGPPTDA